MWFAFLLMVLGAEPVPAATTRVAFVGDVNFAGRRDLGRASEIFADLDRLTATATIVVANVEGLLLAESAPAYGEERLNVSAPPGFAAALATSHITLLGTANNHSWDAGAAGVLENLGHLARHKTAFGTGADATQAFAPVVERGPAGCLSFVPATLKSNRRPQHGAMVAYYGPAKTGAERDVPELLALVTAERAKGCAPIVTIHWGRENKPLPEAAIIAVGHALVDAGAALVIGHHPHVMQGVELRTGPYGPAAIAWSLGNFVFRNSDPDKRRSGIFEATFTRTATAPALSAASLTPMTIDARTFAPREATAREVEQHLAAMTKRSQPFGTTVRLAGGRLEFTRP